MKCLFFKYFYILIDSSFLLETFNIISLCYKRLLLLKTKDAIIHLKKIMFLLRWKNKN